MLAIVGVAYRPTLTLDLTVKASYETAKAVNATQASATAGGAPTASGATSVDTSTTTTNSPEVSRASVDAPRSNQPTASSRSGSTVTWDSNSGRVSGSGLVAGYCCAGAYSTVLANQGVTRGHHYWELTLDSNGAARSPRSFTTAGVTIGSSGAAPLHPPRKTDAAAAIPFGHASRYRHGDTFMFALDAAQAVLYIGVNGTWLNGDPAAGTGGGKLDAQAGAALRPYVNVTAPESTTGLEDRWNANFGGTSFKYSVPSGYMGYGGVAAVGPVAVGSTAVSSPATVVPQASSLMGREFRDQVTLGGTRIPLPDGNWSVVAFFRGSTPTDGDSVVLARIEQNRLQGVIAAKAGELQGNQLPTPFPSCERQDYVYRETKADESGGVQRCWWINHSTGIWQSDSLLRAAAAELGKRGITPPTVMLNVGFRRADKSSQVTAFYYFDPTEKGISSQPLLWKSSEWHKDRIASDPRRVEYVDQLKQWGAKWAPNFVVTR